jgi:hypothetical protein
MAPIDFFRSLDLSTPLGWSAALAPELFLTGAALVVLLFVAWRHSTAADARIAGWLTVASLVLGLLLLVGMATAYPAGTVKNVSDATAALVLLDCISPLGSAHVLPLPLRPAKLRALLTQLLTVAASPPSPVSSEAG